MISLVFDQRVHNDWKQGFGELPYKSRILGAESGTGIERVSMSLESVKLLV